MVWTAGARDDVEQIWLYIAGFDVDAADRMSERLISAGDGLKLWPERGRPASQGLRELTNVWPYIIRYRVDGEVATIITVRHGRRRPLP